MAQTRTFVPPPLCGCELQITADWATDPIDGKMYQHPASSPTNNTIKDIQIVSQCATHAGWETALNGDPFALRRGYMPLPATPTQGEILYMNLWAFDGSKTKLDTCECEIATVGDRSDNSTKIHQHPKHSKKCKYHIADDNNHTQALSECKLKNDTLAEIKKDYPELLYDEKDAEGNIIGQEFKKGVMAWKFDEQRNLEIYLPTLTKNKKDAFQAKQGSKVKII